MLIWSCNREQFHQYSSGGHNVYMYGYKIKIPKINCKKKLKIRNGYHRNFYVYEEFSDELL